MSEAAAVQTMFGPNGEKFTIHIDPAIINARNQILRDLEMEIVDGMIKTYGLLRDRSDGAKVRWKKRYSKRKVKVLMAMAEAWRVGEETLGKLSGLTDDDRRKIKDAVVVVAQADFEQMGNDRRINNMFMIACSSALMDGDVAFFGKLSKGNLKGPERPGHEESWLVSWADFYLDNWCTRNPKELQLCMFTHQAAVDLLQYLGYDVGEDTLKNARKPSGPLHFLKKSNAYVRNVTLRRNLRHIVIAP